MKESLVLMTDKLEGQNLFKAEILFRTSRLSDLSRRLAQHP